MIARTIEPTLREVASQYPVVAVTGPRQSGKTTTCRREFGDHAYVSLEADAIVEAGAQLIAVEAKSGATTRGSFFRHLGAFAEAMEAQSGAPQVVKRVLYGGDETQTRGAGELISWASIQSVDWS